MEQPAVGPPTAMPPTARALTRGLCILVLLLCLGAIVYSGWVVLAYAGQIGV